jgi:hypothetical protein
MGMFDLIRLPKIPQVPAAWYDRDLQTKDLLDITDGGWAEDNRFQVLPERVLVRGSSWEDADERLVLFTGEVVGCDFDPPWLSGEPMPPLYEWRMVFRQGYLEDIRGPRETGASKDPADWANPWGSLPNLLAP